MANEEHVELIRAGVAKWNWWRREHPQEQPDFTHADLSNANLREADLIGADLRSARLRAAYMRSADLREANLTDADLTEVDLSGALLIGANLTGAKLTAASLVYADLIDADLTGADLTRADLISTDLTNANLTDARLVGARLLSTVFHRAILTGCTIYGIAAWDVDLTGAVQTNLRITSQREPEITVDDLEVAQFLHVMLHNEKIRKVIDTITSKVVLILGRFTESRKVVLEALREALRAQDYVPVLFDFDGPASASMTETITLLARMAHFVIADLTDPASVPWELAKIVPDAHVPVQTLLLEGASTFSMAPDLWRLNPHLMLPLYRYHTLAALLATLNERVIAPAEAKAQELQRLRSQPPSGLP